MCWILCGDDKKRIGQVTGITFHGDLVFLHGFEQCALGFRCGAVDLVGEYELREDRPGMKFK